jgi:hypothetical protein
MKVNDALLRGGQWLAVAKIEKKPAGIISRAGCEVLDIDKRNGS